MRKMTDAQRQEAIGIAEKAIQNQIDILSEQKQELAVTMVSNIEYLLEQEFKKSGDKALELKESRRILEEESYEVNPLTDIDSEVNCEVLEYVYDCFGIDIRKIWYPEREDQ